MITIDETRQKYPHLRGKSDEEVVSAVHQAFYRDLPIERVAESFGFVTPSKESANASNSFKIGK